MRQDRQIHIQQGGLAEMMPMYHDMKGMTHSHLCPETQEQVSKQTENKNISKKFGASTKIAYSGLRRRRQVSLGKFISQISKVKTFTLSNLAIIHTFKTDMTLQSQMSSNP